jgi:hypothetical protein
VADQIPITVGGQRVMVDSKFADLPKDQQDATVDEIAKSLGQSKQLGKGETATGDMPVKQDRYDFAHNFTGGVLSPIKG